MHTIVEIDGNRIDGWESFHDLFADAMGFPAFYGRNMDAWIDCMTSLDDPDDGMTSIHAPEDGVLVLSVRHCTSLAARCPEIYDALVECSAFVNYRRLEAGERPVLALSFFRRDA